MGVTGERSSISTNLAEMVSLVREASPDIPCAIGFGISTPEQAREMAKISDGVIVGSAIVRIIGEQGRGSVESVGAYVRRMKQALL